MEVWLIIVGGIYGLIVLFNLGYFVDCGFAPGDNVYYQITRVINRYSYYNIVKFMLMVLFVLLTPVVMLTVFIIWGFKRV